jgi:thiamine pyrophosphate-dependent acetolactate synthase large subunit-like protein
MIAVTSASDLFVTSIGGTIDDMWELRQDDNVFFTTVLGSVSSTALGLALALPHRRVIAIETDGSVLMNTGAMCTLGLEAVSNLTVAVMDNGIYENIGGPPTHTSRGTDLAAMARGAGCADALSCNEVNEFAAQFERMINDDRFGYLVARIVPDNKPWPPEPRKHADGSPANEKRSDGVEDKYRFLRYVERLEGIRIL